MAVHWSKDVDSSLKEAQQTGRLVLIDFSAAPAWGACARLEAESYADEGVAGFIDANFLPVESHIKEHPAWFHRFGAIWTPTILILDSKGRERHRIEGYLPKEEFQAQLEMGLGRLAFEEKKWPDAERIYGEVVETYPKTSSVPEARYWRAVSRYKRTSDHTVLGQVAQELHATAPESIWTKKASPWLGH
jgi:hypothetical protein